MTSQNRSQYHGYFATKHFPKPITWANFNAKKFYDYSYNSLMDLLYLQQNGTLLPVLNKNWPMNLSLVLSCASTYKPCYGHTVFTLIQT